MPTETASASSVLRPCPVDSTRTRARVWRARPQPSAVSRWVSGPPVRPRPSTAQPRLVQRRAAQRPVALAADRNSDDVQRLQRRVNGGRGPRCLVRIDRDHDAVGGLLLRSTGMSSGRAHQLSASQASLRPLPADGAGPGHKPSESQPGGRQV